MAFLFRNHRGFSLIEAMVALGVLSVGGYFLVALMKTGSSGQKTLLAQDDARVITDNIAMLLSDANACANTFGGADVVSGSGTPITVVKDKNNVARFSTGQKYGNRGLQLGSINIGGTGIDAKTQLPLWAPAAAGTGTAFARVDWVQTGAADSSQGPQHLFRFFLVQVSAMNGNTVASCTAMPGGGGANYWTQNTTGDIYNNNNDGAGNVGIGTNAPAAKLDVAGGIRPGHATTGASCSGTAEGSFGYDASAHAPVFCDVTGKWAAIGANGGEWGTGVGAIEITVGTVGSNNSYIAAFPFSGGLPALGTIVEGTALRNQVDSANLVCAVGPCVGYDDRKAALVGHWKLRKMILVYSTMATGQDPNLVNYSNIYQLYWQRID